MQERQGISKMALELASFSFDVTAFLNITLFSNFFQLRNLIFCFIGASNRRTKIDKKIELLGQIENIWISF